jgi:formylglycine-generating enzyme required for sulfatase activity
MKLMLTALLFGCLLVPPLWSLAQSQRGQGVRIKVETGREIDLYDESHALVIGVRKYTDGWRELPGAERDAEAVSAVLRKQGFRVTVALNPTAAQLNEALTAFISDHGLPERNRLLVYFAGHGHTESLADGRELGYVVPADAPLPERNPQLFSRRAISMDEIEAKALRIRSKHAIFVFDSCFSGSIFEVRAERNVPPEIESKTAAPVRLFITAGTKNQPVPDDSIFRLYFVRAFEQREGDLNRDGFITGEELGMYLSGRVASDSRDTQTPRYGKIKNARLNLGDVVFALPRREVSPPLPAFDPASLELAIWQSADRSNEVSDYEEYLRQYPRGRFAIMARNRIARLRASNANTPSSSNPASTVAPSVRMSVAGVAITPLATFTTVTVDANGKITDRRPNLDSWGYVEDLGNGVKLEMVEIPAGEFLMGEDAASAAYYEKECVRYYRKDECARWAKSETPQRKVKLNGFLMGKYEVTQKQWVAVMGALPLIMSDPRWSKLKGDDLPVVAVSWDNAQEFIRKLNEKLKLNRSAYRLPSEAEWEYAARAGTRTPYAFGETISPDTANYWWDKPHRNAPVKKLLDHTVKVGSYPANAFGLFDMHGNVWELCEDDWHDSYTGAPADGSAWVDLPSRGSYRVYRGGSWSTNALLCRSAYRSIVRPGSHGGLHGFRLLRTYR